MEILKYIGEHIGEITTIIGLVGTIIGFFKTFKSSDNSSSIYGKPKRDREKWKLKIEDIAEKINLSNMKNINNVLHQLKFYINGSGMYSSRKYPHDMLLNYEKDEHIWKMIDKLRNCKNHNSFEKYKNTMINYLVLRQNFEFDIIKVKFKIRFYFIISVFLFSLFNGIFYYYERNISFYAKLYLMQLFLTFVIYGINDIRNWYEDKNILLWSIFSILVQYIYFFIQMLSKKEYNILQFEIVYFIIHVLISFLLFYSSNIIRQFYSMYNYKITQFSKNNSIYLYYGFNIFKAIKVNNVFYKYNFRIKLPKQYDNIDYSEINNILVGIENKKGYVGSLFKILKLYSFIFYGIRYMIKQQTILEFIKEKPKRCKIIIVYKKDGKEYYCISNRKSDWEKFLKKCLNITHNN